MKWTPKRAFPGEKAPYWAKRICFLLSSTTLLHAVSCREETLAPIQDVHAEIEDIGTLVTVEWLVPGSTPQRSWVELTGSDGSETSVEAQRQEDGTYRAQVYQLKPGMVYEYRAAIFKDGYIARSGDYKLTTNTVPVVLPDLDIYTSDASGGTDGLILTTLISNISYPVILDADSDLVWWYVEDNGKLTATRAQLSVDGESILFNGFNIDDYFVGEDGSTETAEDDAFIYKVSLDGTQSSVFTTPTAHHDFTELPDGTLAYLTAEFQEVGGKMVRGDGVAELSPDGSIVQVWSAWDDPELYASWYDSHYFTLPMANALEYVESDDAYYVSIGQVLDGGCFLKLDRSSGQLLWVFGGEASDFDMAAVQRAFSHQHQFDVLDGGLLIFDNGVDNIMDSRAVEYSLDQDSMQADETWSYHADPPLYTYALGDASRLPGGGTMITWGTAGQLDELNPDAELVRQLRTEIGAGIGYISWLDGLNAEL